MDKALVLHVAELGLIPTTIYTPQIISVTERRWFKYCSLLQSSCHPLPLLPHLLISSHCPFRTFIQHWIIILTLWDTLSPLLYAIFLFPLLPPLKIPFFQLLCYWPPPHTLLAMLGEKSRSPAGCSHIQCQTAQMAMVADAIIFS